LEAAAQLQFVGGNPSPTVVAEQKQAGVSNYLVGNDPSQWHTNVANYAQVRYQNVYPGIDVVFHGGQGNLEYDFDVAAGVNPSQIALAFTPSGTLSLDQDGNLVLSLGPVGTLVADAPVMYQTTAAGKVAVRGGFTLLGGNEVGFRIDAPYDLSLPLIIDPTLSWSTLLGGSKDDNTGAGSDMVLDSSANVYVAGGTLSTDFPTTAGVFQTKNNGGTDVFVTKLNPTATALVYSTYIGGAKDETGESLVVDSSGDVFVAGTTNSTDYPTTAGVLQTKLSAGATNNVFVTKLKADGTGLLYSTYLGGTADDNARGIAVDSSGDAFVTGSTTSTDFPTTAGVVATKNAGGQDVFVTELDPNGAKALYSTYVGGAKDDAGEAIAIDSSGNAYVTGFTKSTDFNTTAGVVQTKQNGTQNAFVFKLNSTGTTLTYSTYLGGSQSETGRGIALDAAGNAYVTGQTDSTDFATTGGAFQTKLAGGTDAFVSKLNTGGTALLYSTYLGGSKGGAPNSDVGERIKVDANGLAYVIGTTNSTDFPTTTGTFQATKAGGNDAFLTILNASGSAPLVYSTYLGGKQDETGNAIALDSAGNVYVAGTTGSTDFPTTTGVVQTSNKGGNDIFVTKFANTIVPPPPPPPPPPGGGGVPFVPSDQFEPNDTSDVATNMGAAGAVQTFPNLTINLKPTGLFDQDWYKWSIPTSGTLNVTLNNISAFGGDLWLRVFELNSDNTLTQIGSSTVTGGVSVQTALESVTAGQEINVWVFGFNNAVGTYTLNVTLT
jgi:hypothetical protein